MPPEPELPLYVRPSAPDPQTPFEGDLFERLRLADRLTSYIGRLPQGCVFAIDAAWGEGKTWFATHWQAYLRRHDFKTIYIDTFARDYVDDPFLMVSSAITMTLAAESSPERGKLSDATARVAKALLPIATKLALATAGRLILGSVDAIEDIRKLGEEAAQNISDAVQQHLRKRLDEYEIEHESVTHFKKLLAEFAAKQQKPIVVLVDELDRCRPTFAVRTIERIKHFFDVPGLVFVLLVHRPQLESAFKGIYGESLDAATYVGKFIQFYVSLPKRASFEAAPNDFSRIYCDHLARQYGLPRTDTIGSFSDCLSVLATHFHLSPRDLERAFILLSMAYPKIQRSAFLLSWFIALKLRHPALFSGLLRNDRNAHAEAEVLISNILKVGPEFWPGRLLQDLHKAHAEDFTAPLKAETTQALGDLGRWVAMPERCLPWLIRAIDLSVSD